MLGDKVSQEGCTNWCDCFDVVFQHDTLVLWELCTSRVFRMCHKKSTFGDTRNPCENDILHFWGVMSSLKGSSSKSGSLIWGRFRGSISELVRFGGALISENTPFSAFWGFFFCKTSESIRKRSAKHVLKTGIEVRSHVGNFSIFGVPRPHLQHGPR